MKRNKPGIDLHQEFIELFRKEEMLAFFDFQSKTDKDAPFSGLCKVSKPAPGKSDSMYLSLLFIIETPEEQLWRDVAAWFDAIDWEGLSSRLPEFESVLSIPYSLESFTGNFFQEVDVYLKKGTVLSRSYVLGTLYPAVRTVAGIEAGEPVFWEDLPNRDRGATTQNTGSARNGGSLISRLQEFFKF